MRFHERLELGPIGGEEVDIRVSALPLHEGGESAVLRFLRKATLIYDMSLLGLSPDIVSVYVTIGSGSEPACVGRVRAASQRLRAAERRGVRCAAARTSFTRSFRWATPVMRCRRY